MLWYIAFIIIWKSTVLAFVASKLFSVLFKVLIIPEFVYSMSAITWWFLSNVFYEIFEWIHSFFLAKWTNEGIFSDQLRFCFSFFVLISFATFWGIYFLLSICWNECLIFPRNNVLSSLFCAYSFYFIIRLFLLSFTVLSLFYLLN